MSAGLIMIAAALGAPAAPGGLHKGDQLTFVGTVAEQVRRPGKQFRRNHDLELRVFVLDRTEKWADVAVLTRLKRTGDAVAQSAETITSSRPRPDAPPLIRLDLVRVHADGTAHLLTPARTPGTSVHQMRERRAVSGRFFRVIAVDDEHTTVIGRGAADEVAGVR